MARTVAELPKGARITDYISLGVIAEKIPLKHIQRETGRESRRQRNLPAHVEFFGLMLAHFAVRSLMHEAALQADLDPDQLSTVVPSQCPGASAAKSLGLFLFPPQETHLILQEVLEEILEERGGFQSRKVQGADYPPKPTKTFQASRSKSFIAPPTEILNDQY